MSVVDLTKKLASGSLLSDLHSRYFELDGLVWFVAGDEHYFNRSLRRLLRLPEVDAAVSDDQILQVFGTEGIPSDSVAIGHDPIGGDRIEAYSGSNRLTLERASVRLSRTHVVHSLTNVTEQIVQDRTLQMARFSLDKSADPIVWATASGRIVYHNQALQSLTGFNAKELRTMTMQDILDPPDRMDWQDRVVQLRNAGSRQGIGGLNTTNGGVIPVEIAENYLVQDRVVRISVLMRDLRERERLTAELLESEDRFESLFSLLPSPVIISDLDTGRLLALNPRACAILGVSRADALGRDVQEFYADPTDNQTTYLGELNSDQNLLERDLRMRADDGREMWIRVTSRLIRHEGRNAVLSSFSEVSSHKRLEGELRKLATLDALTGLLNRRQFMSLAATKLEHLLARDEAAAVLLMDLDHFKEINDRFGHPTGDEALVAFARACRKEFRGQDLTGRIGGEEFAVLLPETDSDRAAKIAERVRRRVGKIELRETEHVVTFTVSIGVIQVRKGEKIAEAIARADQALYLAKQNGRNRIEIA